MEWIKKEPGKYAKIVGMDPRAEWLLDPKLGLPDYMPGLGSLLDDKPSLRDYIPSERLVSFIMRLDSKKGLKEFKRLREHLTKVFVPSFYFGPPDRVNVGEYFMAIARMSFFDDLARNPDYAKLRVAPKHIQLGLPLRTDSLPDWKPGEGGPRVEPPAPLMGHEWPDGTVVIGIIDDGIAFAHQRFRDAPDSTRVQYFWQQDGTPEPGAPRTVDYGRELCKRSTGSHRGIDDLLRASRRGEEPVDEEEVYRRSGLLDFAHPEHKAVAWRSAHGTHVLDLAAGEDWATDDEEARHRIARRPIIAVQLPVAATADTSGAGLEPHVLDGIEYILHRASLLAGEDPSRPPNERGKLPVVINFSYGTNAGPHDGSSPLERSMDRLMSEPRAAPLRIVLPAGNANLARCHAEVTFSSSGPRSGSGAAQPNPVCLNWRLLPDDRTRSILEIWLPEGRPPQEPWISRLLRLVRLGPPPQEPRISLSIETPDGSESGQHQHLCEGDKHVLQAVLGKHVICDARYALVSVPADGQNRAVQRGLFRIMVQPTTRLLPTAVPELDKRVSPPGLWKVWLHNHAQEGDFKVQAFIERDDTARGYPVRGRQSHFDHGCYERFDEQGRERADDPPDRPCIVKRAGMISGIATGEKTIVVGGYLRKERDPSSYSAGGSVVREGGTTSKPEIRGPDAAMVSDDSKVHAGVLAAGSRSGSVVAMRGTSVAAPRVARIVADQLAEAAEAGTKAAGNNPAVEPESRAAIVKLAHELEARRRSGDARVDEKPPVRSGAGRIRPPKPPPWRERYFED